jgi:putative methionine-R-sulfoxide reductase with GAF domain
MNTSSSLDRETFQQLLASAFAVQESQINSQSLSDIMDVQRSVARGKLDLDSTMRHIVESARKVANAAGVAIALLNGDQLTYRAGSGTSASCIGQHVMALLTVSADAKTSREILRVENAQTDTRIEADICRQFGANALLILPIYYDRAVAGVLDVRFSEAHAFQDGEVRTYRLMAEQIEAAMFQAAQLDQKKTRAAELPPIPEVFEQIAPPSENFVPAPEFFMLPENEHSLYARCGAVLVDVMELPVFKQCARLVQMLTQRAKHLTWPNPRRNLSPAAVKELPVFKQSILLATVLKQRAKHLTWPIRRRDLSLAAVKQLPVFKQSVLFATMLTQRAKSLTWPLRRRDLTVAAVAVVLAFSGWIAYKGRGPISPLESSTLPTSTSVDQQSPLPKPLPGKNASAVQPAPGSSKEARHARTALRRVRVGPNEVDYIGEDVTVRIFKDKPAAKRSRAPDGRIAHLGDDVTVRYFTPPPRATRTASR